ncbi:PQQ-like beta-propeller repeat protein, partial [Candidatus Sumerlaeota bacterium]|nr:PQQ-like beta-propeller repeat protein [Candidatus Sumerlaeota bacterium]
MSHLKCGAVMIAAVAWSHSASADNWPQWRGPTADGICGEKNLPVSWSATENIAWKTPLKGKGESTPIIWGDRIFLTYQTGQNPPSKGPTNGGLDQDPFPNDATLDIHLFVAGFEKSSGKLLWEHEVKTDNVIGTHRKHNMATPSCTTDGERVYAWFGSGQLGCYDFDGKVIWERDLSQEYGPFVIIWGHGSSPVLYGDGLILLCDHARTPYILAVDKKTGKNIWETERPKGVRSYSTPYFVKVGGKDQMIVNTAGEVQGLDPANGSIIWNAKGILVAPVPSPVASGDLLFTYGGYDSGPIMAIKLGGAGDVTDSNVLWKKQKGGPYVPSLVYDGKY